MLETSLRQAATVLLESAIRIAPPDAREWGQALRAELSYVEGPWTAVMWALGGANVMAKHALVSLFIPGRGQGIASGDGLSDRNVSLRKVALVASGAYILAALIFFAAPPFRQAIRVSLAAWTGLFHLRGWNYQPQLAALAKRAEQRHDAEGLAFCAVRLEDSRASARWAAEAVRLDPNLLWVYAVVAAPHPDLPEISQWVPKLKRWDSQNALFHLITAESIDIAHVSEASKLPPKEFQKKMEEDPTWRSAMTAAFASARFDDYLDRLRELDRKVVSGYRFNDPYEVLASDESGLPSYAFWDSQQFAKSLFQSGQKLEAKGDRRGAAEKYWAVARFGQVIDSQGHTDSEHEMGSSLQAGAYKHLLAVSEKEGNHEEAALFAYLAAKFNLVRGERDWLHRRWVFGQIFWRNAAVLQLSSLTMVLFSGLLLVAASILIVGGRGGGRSQRAMHGVTVMALTSAVGLLLSSATVYLTYRPYWYIFQGAIVGGDWSQTRDLRDFLWATWLLPGVRPFSYLHLNLPVYFWTGVTLLGLMGLGLILLRHVLARPRASASA